MLMLLNISLKNYKKTSSVQTKIVKPLSGLLILVFFVLFSTMAKADGLFDFQMKLAKKGNAEAEFKIGEMYETGFGVKKDMKEAMLWITKAAAQGHENASFKMLYWDIQKNGLKGENKKKFSELRTKANDGNVQAMYYVGKMYAYGVGVKTNYDKSLDWLNKATFAGVLEAEREAVIVREMKQQALASSRKVEEERKLKEQEKKKEEEMKADAEKKSAEQRLLSDKAKKKKEVAAKKVVAEKKENEEKTKREEAENAEQELKKKEQLAENERKKQLLLKKKAEEKRKKEKQSKFESDPCSGKSARFLSTCR